MDLHVNKPPGTSCVQAEMLCEHSLWSHNPADLSCEGGNTTAREGGRLLQVSRELASSYCCLGNLDHHH